MWWFTIVWEKRNSKHCWHENIFITWVQEWHNSREPFVCKNGMFYGIFILRSEIKFEKKKKRVSPSWANSDSNFMLSLCTFTLLEETSATRSRIASLLLMGSQYASPWVRSPHETNLPSKTKGSSADKAARCTFRFGEGKNSIIFARPFIEWIIFLFSAKRISNGVLWSKKKKN